MKLVIQEREELEIVPCDCGSYPEFIYPNWGYTDVWLECPKCGKRTWNTGGFHYAMEIPLQEAKLAAVNAWNNKEYRN